MPNLYNLERFLTAQDSAYETALAELRAGERRTDWMMFFFPRLHGLGSGPLARHFALGSLAEARAFQQHPILGARLEQCLRLCLRINSATAFQIFGPTEDKNFQASLTLFQAASPERELFREALLRFFDGSPDPLTLAILSQDSEAP